MKFLVAALLATSFLEGALAKPVTSCIQYEDCMTTTIEQVSPECGDTGCSFKVCYTLSNVGDGGLCDKKAGGTFSHVCDNGSGDNLMEQCNVDEMANKSDWKYIGSNVPGFSACQYVEAGGYAYFTSKDGGGCADSFSNTLAIGGSTGSASYKCEQSDDLGVSGLLCSGGGVNECVFSVGPMPDCEGVVEGTPVPTRSIDEECGCLDQFVSEPTTPTYDVATKIIQFNGALAASVHSRNVELADGSVVTDAALLELGGDILEISSEGYYLNGAETTLVTSVGGYSVYMDATANADDYLVVADFGLSFLEFYIQGGAGSISITSVRPK